MADSFAAQLAEVTELTVGIPLRQHVEKIGEIFALIESRIEKKDFGSPTVGGMV